MKRFNRVSKSLLLSSSLLVLSASMLSITLQADEIVIPVGQQGADKASLDRPKVGMKADVVESRLGAPLKKSPPIGKPPISNWEYPYYTVYFESDRVIHTVIKPQSTTVPETTTAPEPTAAPIAVPEATTTPEPAATPESVVAPAVVAPEPAAALPATEENAPVDTATVTPAAESDDTQNLDDGKKDEAAIKKTGSKQSKLHIY